MGVFDPNHTFADANNIAVEHVFISWLDDNRAALTDTSSYTRAKNRWLMVTLEPFPTKQPIGNAALLREIEAGRYDSQIDNVCGDLASLQSPIFVRWGHEMDAVTERYPWAHADGTSFVNAYRHFVDRCRQHSDRFLYVWSPRGDRGLGSYYPGKSYVDYVGLSVYSLPEAELATYGRIRSFKENFGEKYNRVKEFDQPVMIAELGVSGSVSHR